MTFHAHARFITEVLPSADGQTFTTTSGDSYIRVWDAKTFTKLYELVGTFGVDRATTRGDRLITLYQGRFAVHRHARTNASADELEAFAACRLAVRLSDSGGIVTNQPRCHQAGSLAKVTGAAEKLADRTTMAIAASEVRVALSHASRTAEAASAAERPAMQTRHALTTRSSSARVGSAAARWFPRFRFSTRGDATAATVSRPYACRTPPVRDIPECVPGHSPNCGVRADG
jgi:hypothetical protein